MAEKKTYEALESFAIRSGVQILPGETCELTDQEARTFLHYGRIRIKPASVEEDEGGPEVETRDPESGDRDPRVRRRR